MEVEKKLLDEELRMSKSELENQKKEINELHENFEVC